MSNYRSSLVASLETFLESRQHEEGLPERVLVSPLVYRALRYEVTPDMPDGVTLDDDAAFKVHGVDIVKDGSLESVIAEYEGESATRGDAQ